MSSVVPVAIVLAVIATDLSSLVVQPMQAPTEQSIRIAPEQLSPEELQADFGRIEEALRSLQIDAGGNVVLSAETESALTAATAGLPPDTSVATLRRLQFLIRQRLPGRAGEQMAALLDEYYRYRQIELRELPGTPTAQNIDSEIQVLEKKMALRERHFGKTRADRLFGEKHRLTLYILALRRMDMDASLSEAAREKKRRQLHARYERRDQQYLLLSAKSGYGSKGNRQHRNQAPSRPPR